MKIAIVLGTSTGTTEDIANDIADGLRERCNASIALVDVADITALPPDERSAAWRARLSGVELLIVGCPTWDIGQLQADWRELLGGFEQPARRGAPGSLAGLELRGVTAVFFGLGDQAGYPDTYQDAMGILHDAFEAAGARVGLGHTAPSGDTFEASRALVDGRFCGLAIDEDSLPQQTEGRVRRWVAQLVAELGLGASEGGAGA